VSPADVTRGRLAIYRDRHSAGFAVAMPRDVSLAD
jgi:hypothetical protein